MKDFFRKKYIVLILATILIMGSTKAFASGGLFNNIVDIVRNIFAIRTETVMEDTEQDLIKIGEEKTNDIKDYINNSYAQVIAEINAYKNTELARGKMEIDDYLGEFNNQMEAVVTEEKSKLQQKISEKIDKNINKIKKDLDKEIEKYIKDLTK